MHPCGKTSTNPSSEKGMIRMEADMSIADVMKQIKQMQENGEALSKKAVKVSHPKLMKNALYYFPSWEHAIQNSVNA